MSEFNIHDVVVRRKKSTKPFLWKIRGVGQLFKNSWVCHSDSELLHHLKEGELRHATPEEIKAGKRL